MILVNGETSDLIDVRDRGLHYGDGLFETLAVRDGRPELLEAHLERLARGCRVLGITGVDPALLAREIEQAAAGESRCVLKLVVTRGCGGRGYRPPGNLTPQRILVRSPWPDYPETWQTAGVAVRLCDTPLGLNPRLAGLKHLNRLEQVIARQEWGDEAAEGLMRDVEGFVVEGTMSNLFAVRGERLLTPPVDRCGVAGVMRRTVLELADALGIPCEETRLTAEALFEADGLFLTNSLFRIWPVHRLDGRSCGRSPVTEALSRALTTRLEG